MSNRQSDRKTNINLYDDKKPYIKKLSGAPYSKQYEKRDSRPLPEKNNIAKEKEGKGKELTKNEKPNKNGRELMKNNYVGAKNDDAKKRNQEQQKYTKRIIIDSKKINQEKKSDVSYPNNFNGNVANKYNWKYNDKNNNDKSYNIDKYKAQYNNNNNINKTRSNQRKDITSIDKRMDFSKLNTRKLNYIADKEIEKRKEKEEDTSKKKEYFKETENYLCHACQGKVFIELNQNNLTVNVKCENGHEKKNMPIKEFFAKNELNKKKVLCYDCRKDNFQKDLYFCQCGKNICGKCKRNHKNHSQIPFSEKSYYCTEHQKKYMYYCSNCKKNICNDCLSAHNKHNNKIINFDDVLKDKEIKECKRNLEKMKQNKKLFDDKFDKYIELLKNKKKIFDQNCDNFTKLQNDLINAMDNKESLNYENIMNFKKLNNSLSNNQNNIFKNYLNIQNNFINEGNYLLDLLGENENRNNKKKEKIMKIVSKEQNFDILKENKKSKKIDDKKNKNAQNIINDYQLKEKDLLENKIIDKNKNKNDKNKLNDSKSKVKDLSKNKIIDDKKKQNAQSNLNDPKLKEKDSKLKENDLLKNKIIDVQANQNAQNKEKEKELLRNKITEKVDDKNARPKESKISPEVKREITVLDKIENCKLKLDNRDERCITSFAILRNNKILLTYKGGIIKIYEFEKNINSPSDINNPNEIQLKEILRLEEEEYCFNYGIELKNGNVGVCSEDGTVKIIQLFLEEKPKDNIKYRIIQKIEEQNQDPIYTMKELDNESLILGCWKNLLLFQKANEYELLNKIPIGDYTFSVLELSPNVVVCSHSETKTLSVHDFNEYEDYSIQNIESNENNNIICKYNNKNEIVFVGYDKGVSIVSIINKCLIKKIELGEIISGLCPMGVMLDLGDGRTKKVFGLLCGAKRKIYGEKVNFAYSLLQLGFNMNNEDKGEINSTDNKDIEYTIISRKDRVHYYDVTNLQNSIFSCNNNSLKINENKNDQWFFSSGNEDKLLKIWKL